MRTPSWCRGRGRARPASSRRARPTGWSRRSTWSTDDLRDAVPGPHGPDRRAHPGPPRPARPDLERGAAAVGHRRAGLRGPRRRPADDHARARRLAVRRPLRARAAGGPAALSRMPSFPGDNLDPGRCHGDLLVLVQSDHAMITHHALRDVMRRTKGRLEGRWAQSCFQRFDEDNPSTRRRAGRGRRARAARLPRRLAEHRRRPPRADLRGRGGAGVGARRAATSPCA